ncbi:hypothetical protein [Ruminococcus sp.]|uniref:hypothetical protein n=1 Tax=Ruminococcus sp. TaxID=41978 RepID=UPI0025D7BAD5|nr:hypothetical protein [Ruminococcus sp.]MBR1433099.1 hypothetical protein [Ruminococcus sp.]
MARLLKESDIYVQNKSDIDDIERVYDAGIMEWFFEDMLKQWSYEKSLIKAVGILTNEHGLTLPRATNAMMYILTADGIKRDVLYRNMLKLEYVPATYYISALVNENLYRIIGIPTKCTMIELADIIVEAFDLERGSDYTLLTDMPKSLSQISTGTIIDNADSRSIFDLYPKVDDNFALAINCQKPIIIVLTIIAETSQAVPKPAIIKAMGSVKGVL